MIRQSLLIAAVLSLGGLAACGDTSGGGAQEAGGEVKEAVGTVIGNDEMKAEGQADQVEGNAKQAVENVKEAVSDVVN